MHVSIFSVQRKEFVNICSIFLEIDLYKIISLLKSKGDIDWGVLALCPLVSRLGFRVSSGNSSGSNNPAMHWAFQSSTSELCPPTIS